jgi:hypothetical protein
MNASFLPGYSTGLGMAPESFYQEAGFGRSSNNFQADSSPETSSYFASSPLTDHSYQLSEYNTSPLA